MTTQLEHLPTAALIPYARNARTHSEAQINQISASITEFGFTNPVLIDKDNGIIAGHGRVMAAGLLGLKQVPCLRLSHLTDAQKRAYIIADNQLALNAGWDEELLRLELLDLQEFDFDLDLIGFDTNFLDDLLSGEAGGLAAAPAAKPGSLSDKFLIPPFSVLNAREGWWQARKQQWLALGIQSELGRGGDVTYGDSPEITGVGLNYYRNQKKINATPGGHMMPAANYSQNRKRGNGKGQSVG